ncbi:MAG: class I SAM-dependent methyltransferase [Spirochaetaceae bacterium]|jgi:SAM-dependent methyltransferase|nr:class I SAM-dependent methyltransferase [Spirochaetaceae bacterium]
MTQKFKAADGIPEWDYSKHAEFYSYRPNYAPKAIDMLIEYVGAKKQEHFMTADIGAGTGNLTKMLLERGLNVTAVEPNGAMRRIGIEETKNYNVIWSDGTGTETGLESGKYNWVTFGSSFNVIDRELGLKEAHRLSPPPPNSYFTCMWNHRNLTDAIQKTAEDIIEKFVPSYDRGVRREDQRPFLEEHSALFKNICYLEVDFEINLTIDEYILAWRSVRNKYWDLETKDGQELFGKITREMIKNLPSNFKINYTTRAWTAEKAA